MSFQTIEATLQGNAAQAMAQTCASYLVQRRTGGVTHVYVFFVEGNGDLVYKKSLDGGDTFGAAVIIDNSDNYRQLAVWHEEWTPTNTGTIIHILGANDSVVNADLRYFTLNMFNDMPGAVNDVLIIGTLTMNLIDNGGVNICEATNGEIFVGVVKGNAPTGLFVSRSLDSGATWSATIVADGAAEFSSVTDLTFMLPLITNDDILLIGIDDNFNGGDNGRLKSVVFHNDTDTWDLTSTTIEDGPDNTGFLFPDFAATLDKTTGDVFLVYFDLGLTFSDQASIAFRRYNQTTRTWGSKILVSGDMSNNLAVAPIGTKRGLCICRDQTNGFLMISFIQGGTAGELTVYFMMSSNDGVDWSDGWYVPGQDHHSIRAPKMPLITLDPDNGFYLVWPDHSANILYGLDEPIPITANVWTGTVRDGDGNLVQGVPVAVRQTTARQIFGINYGKNNPLQGVGVTNASGVYRVLTLGLFPTEPAGTLNFYAYGYESHPSGNKGRDRMDLSRITTA